MKMRLLVLALVAFWEIANTGMAQKAEKSLKQGRRNGAPMIWEDRGDLTPAIVYWGVGSRFADPSARRPAPPFLKIEPDVKHGTHSPKARIIDSKQVKWTVKFSPKVDSEVHAEIAATRLAWALGFGTDEDYYVGAGRIEGYDGKINLGRAGHYIARDGSFHETRFKRHNKDADYVKDSRGGDQNWSEAHNPGVPPEQLSGLLIFDVLVHNWDIFPKNCRILHVKTPNGAENWYIVSDMGASFGAKRSKGNLQDYRAEKSFVKDVANGFVELNFYTISPSLARVHQKIPLAHARWFRKQLAKLTDDEIRAAFNAAYATPELDSAYISGDLKKANQLTSPEAAGFAAIFREKINEFESKVPPEP